MLMSDTNVPSSSLPNSPSVKTSSKPEESATVPAYQYIKHWFLFKFLLLYGIMGADLMLNSEIEFQSNSQNGLLLWAGQILCQIFGFLDLFVLLGSTFLFRHGLLGILGSQFKHILCLHPVYTAATIALGIIRIILFQTIEPVELWSIPWYMLLSICHKIMAIFYYVGNMNTLVSLGDPKYYEKEAWINIYTGGAV